ncbi:MAG: class I adenylate-forming enzyme family protein [Planctomycetota bacterium]
MSSRSSLQGLLDLPLRETPGKTAIRTEAVQVSYQELDLSMRGVASGLQRQGVSAGDRVAWFLPNGMEAVVTTLACYQLGAIAVPLNYRYVSEEIGDVLARTGSKLLIFHASRREVVQPLLDSEPTWTAFEVGGADAGFETLHNCDPLSDSVSVAADHPALILFTSGSTGRPKGVVHSHAGAFAGIDISRRVFDFCREDVVLVGKSISHAGGLQTQLMPTLLVGGEVVLAMKPHPSTAVSLIQAHAVSEYGLLASDLLDFIEYLEQTPTELPSLNNAIGSGDCVPQDLHHRFRDLFGWEVMEGAGMTEVGGYYAANPRDGQRRWGSLGVATPDTKIRVIDDTGKDCAVGQTGEIVLQTPSSTTGYWNDPEATAELYRDGWLHSGDLGRWDEDGYLWFVARKKLMIVRRGSNIAPAEIEDVIDEHPAVHASVAVGVKHPEDGQIPVACVALRGQPEPTIEQQLRDYVAQHLAAYKNPVHYLFLEQLPRTGTGKFDRHRLQAIAEQSLGAA